jgi:nucleoside-diphosphate-sugar epimerase
MTVLVTGADRSLGAGVADYLAPDRDLRRCGRTAPDDVDGTTENYSRADLTAPGTAADLVAGVDAALHLAPHDPAPPADDRAECDLLRRASLGTYRLCAAAREAGVDRVVLAGTLGVYDGYPEAYVVDERWKPRPAPEAASLAPYLAELSAREFPREGGIRGICLRMGPLGDAPDGTTWANALHAVECALEASFEPAGYRWHVFNVGNSTRFLNREAHEHVGFTRQEAE